MNILTGEQWSEWRLNPVTVAFLEYLKHKKFEVYRQKMAMISDTVSQIDPTLLSELNGMEKTLTGVLTLDLPTMVNETHMMEEVTKNTKKMIKDNMGVDL